MIFPNRSVVCILAVLVSLGGGLSPQGRRTAVAACAISPGVRGTPVPAGIPPSAPTFRPVALHMFSRTTGWAYNNTAMWWTDTGGRRWIPVTPPGLPRFPVIQPDVVSARTAWVGLENLDTTALWVTTTHGATWQHVSFPRVGVGGVAGLDFLSAHTGWVETDVVLAGPDQTAVYESTADQGQRWRRLSLTLPGIVWLVSRTTAWVSGGSSVQSFAYLYATHDAGQHWRLTALPRDAGRLPAYAMPVASFGPRVGLLRVRLNPPNTSRDDRPTSAVYVTRNGGATWHGGQLLPAPPDSNVVQSYAPGGTGFLITLSLNPQQVATQGTVYRTRNWGRTWQRVSWHGFAPRHLTALDLLTTRVGFAESGAGDHTFWVTTDGGRVWHPVTPGNHTGS